MIPSTPKIKIENFINNIDENIKIITPKNYLLNLHHNTHMNYKKASTLLKLAESTYRSNIQYKIPSIRFLKKLSLFNKTIIDDLYNQELKYTARIKKIILPKFITPKLSYFIGYLHSGGYIGSDKNTYGFADEYIKHLISINKLNKELFGNKGTIRMICSDICKKPTPYLEIRQYVVNSYLHKVFDISRGKKRNLKIPKLFYLNKELLRWYIRGLFDGDGTLPKNPKTTKQLFIDLTLKEKELIIEIKRILIEIFRIKTLDIYERKKKSPSSNYISSTWEIRIRKHEDIKKFLKEIGFYHYDKAKRAKKVLNMLE